MFCSIRTFATAIAGVLLLTTAKSADAQVVYYPAAPVYVYPSVPVVRSVVPATYYDYAAPSVRYYSPSVVTREVYSPIVTREVVVPSPVYYPAPVATTTTTRYGVFGRARSTSSYYSYPVLYP